MLVGYARVSTVEQETALQLDALASAGIKIVFQEKASAVSHRPELQAAIHYMKPGHTLVVWKLDRLARSLFDLLGLLETLAEKGCSFRSLTEPIDTSTPMGVFVLQILGAVAQLERSMIIERTRAGIKAARDRGQVWGRRPLLSPGDALEVVYLARSGVPYASIADAYGISRPLVYKLLSQFPNK